MQTAAAKGVQVPVRARLSRRQGMEARMHSAALQDGLDPLTEPGGGAGALDGRAPGDSECLSRNPARGQPCLHVSWDRHRPGAGDRCQQGQPLPACSRMLGGCSPGGSIEGRRQRSRSVCFCRRRPARPVGPEATRQTSRLPGTWSRESPRWFKPSPIFISSASVTVWCFFHAVCRALLLRSGQASVVTSAGRTTP